MKFFWQFWHHKHKHVAHRLIISSISINNINLKGNIMAFTISKSQKIIATITGLNAEGAAAPISGLSAVSSDTTLATIGAIDTTANTVEIDGVADGSVTITFSANDVNGKAITALVEQGTIADVPPVDNVATSLSVSYSAPVAQ